MNEVVKEYIDTYVKENGNEEITGAILNATLKEMVSELYAHRCYGVITPSLPLLYDEDIPAWGVASQNGTYTNYGGIEIEDELALIVYDGGVFTKQTIISKSWINNLVNDVNNKLIGTATIRYNSTLDVVEIEYTNGTVLQIGREQVSFVYNDTESTIVNGTPVYYSGVGGSGVQMPAIAEADASNLATAMVKGHTTIDIPANSYGIIVCKGEMTVESHGLTVGSKIYLGVGGGYVNTPPSNPNLTIELGIVLDADTLHVYPCIISPFTNSSTSLTSVLFLSNVDSGISTFKNLSKTLDAAETTKTITATNNTVAGEKYISEPLGLTTIPAAVFAAHSICKVSSALGTSKIKFDVSLYHEDTTTTLLFSDESDDINFTVDTVIEFSVPFTAITCLATDRLLIELYFTATHTNPITFTYYVGDGRATHVEIPMPISHTDLSNKNSDDNFLHVTSGQITAWNNKLDSVSIPLSNNIFADSINGNDTSGDGTIIKPYKTLTKVVDSYTYQTVLGYVTSENANVTGVSDVDIAKVKIGDKLKFSGMTTYGHTVVSITLSAGNNTIVTNKNFAVSSGVELSAYTEKLVKAFGTFNIDASIEKDGLFWDFTGATLIVGNATAFNITTVKNSDFVVKGGRWLGVHANSRFVHGIPSNSNVDFYFFPIYAESITTGYFINPNVFRKLYVNSIFGIYATSGYWGYLIGTEVYVGGHNYGLLKGVYYSAVSGEINGICESISTNYALDCNGNPNNPIVINATILGSIKTSNYHKFIINGNIKGQSAIFNSVDIGEVNGQMIVTTGTVTTRGRFTAKGLASGSWTVTNGNNTGDGNSVEFHELAGEIAISNGKNNIVKMSNAYPYILGNITLTNNAQLIVESTQEITEYAYQRMFIASGCTLINKGYMRTSLGSDMAGTLINDGDLYLIDLAAYGITGTLINNKNIYLRSSGGRYSQSAYNATIYLKNGAKCILRGFLDASLMSTFAAIKKDATSTLVFDNARIKMYSGKPLIECTSDVAGSKDIYIFGSCITDADGTTYGLLFPFDGSSYAPNAVIQQQLTESTSLTNIIG